MALESVIDIIQDKENNHYGEYNGLELYWATFLIH